MKCQIISIGNELLIGDTVNTNASWLGQFMTENGIAVSRVHTISDDFGLIRSTIERSLAEAELVITTGGLGPTHDDVTKKAVAELFGAEMVIHEPTLNFVKRIFEKRNIPFSKSNYYQAEVPVNCEVLFNKQGTAPGMWFESEGSFLAVLPGVPFEMKELMNDQVLPRISEMTNGSEHRYSRYILTAGVGESTLSDEIIGELGPLMNEEVSVAYLPSPQGTRIRISAYGHSRREVDGLIEPIAQHIYERAGEVIVGEGKELTLSEAVGKLLREQGVTIASAESCTGGLLSDTLTNIPGSSDYLMGGMVTYSNRSKVELLGVDEATLESRGAVSREVALQMARKVADRFGTDIGISTTGIAGPGGGSAEKPVGTVWIGYWSKDAHFALHALFTNNRLINKERSVAVAIETVRRSVSGIITMPYGLKPHLPE